MENTHSIKAYGFIEAPDGAICFSADVPLPDGNVVKVNGLEYDRESQTLSMSDGWPEAWQAGLLRAVNEAWKLCANIEEKTWVWLDASGKPVEVMVHPEEPTPDLHEHTMTPQDSRDVSDGSPVDWKAFFSKWDIPLAQ